MQNTLSQNGIENLYHTIPLHYLTFICRSGLLLSKERLIQQGFDTMHFRSTSKNADVKRGFDQVVHCTNNPFPPILISKLLKGYQHLEICIRTDVLSEDQFLLCKYNIAKNRGLYTESLSTGWCYNGFKIPVTKTIDEKVAMLTSIDKIQHFEILVKDFLEIPDDAVFRFFSNQDFDIAVDIISKMNKAWPCKRIDHSYQYNVNNTRRNTVNEYLRHSFENADWRGNGLEYDR